MSTFTTINTSIRDSAIMLRVLQGIPGAKVSQNVRLKRKDWGTMNVDFYVELASAASNDRLVGQFVRSGLRYFYVTRENDGSLALHINQDQAEHLDIKQEITSALSAHRRGEAAKLEQDVRQRRDDALRAIDVIADLQRARFADAQSRTSEITATVSNPLGTDSPIHRLDPELVRAEAAQALRRLDREASAARNQEHAAYTKPVNSVSRADESAVVAKLSQEYARQKVLEQLDQIEQQYGMRLSSEAILDDGTIEITLRG